MYLHPTSLFLDILGEAVCWVGEEENTFSCNAQGITESEAYLNIITELSELKECLIQQQAQLDAIM